MVKQEKRQLRMKVPELFLLSIKEKRDKKENLSVLSICFNFYE
jgi:hypothetical protein